MEADKIRKIVKKELEKFRKAQAQVDQKQKERIQQLAGMKQKVTRDTCSKLGMLTMRDFMELMNKLKSAEKGQLHKQNEDKLIAEEDDELVDLTGLVVDDEGAPPTLGRVPKDRM